MSTGSLSAICSVGDEYGAHRRFLLSAKGNALLQVLNGRRLSDGFLFPSTEGFDHNRFPSHFLVTAYNHVLCKLF